MRCWLICAVVLVALTGCTQSTRPGRMHWVRSDSDRQHAGNAYLLRGWLGIFSSGIDELTRKINQAGVRAHVYQDDQWQQLAGRLRQAYRQNAQHEPLVLIGHSYGADDAIRVARMLNRDNIAVDLLITLDPVTPPKIPPNVRRCVNIYQSNGMWDTMPWFRGVAVQADSPQTTQLANYDIRRNRTDLLEDDVDHFNIEKKQKIHAEIVKTVLEACPPRSVWAAARSVNQQPLVPNKLQVVDK